MLRIILNVTSHKKWRYLAATIAGTILFQFITFTPNNIINTYRILTSSTQPSIELPSYIKENLIDKTEYFELVKSHDSKIQSVTPFYWHVAKAGGTTIKDLYLQCYTLITASEIGGNLENNEENGGGGEEDYLRIVHANGSTNHINVDISTVDGILRAQSLHLVQSHIPQLIFTPLFYESTTYLFDSQNKGIMFGMFRNPIDRVISLFYYLQEATWEPTYNPIFKNMTLLEYANSSLLEANFITRSLVNKFTGPLSHDDLEQAKEILRRKCIIGIVEDFDTSITGFDASLNLVPNLHVYTELEDESFENRKQFVKTCIQQLKSEGGSNKHKHEKVEKDSEVYKILETKNGWDMSLWAYIKKLYHEQKEEFQPMIDRKREEQE